MDVLCVVLEIDGVVERGVEVLVGIVADQGRGIGALLRTLFEVDAAGDEAEHGVELEKVSSNPLLGAKLGKGRSTSKRVHVCSLLRGAGMATVGILSLIAWCCDVD